MTSPEALRVYLIAGEPSGDVIGGRLIEAMRTRVPAGVESRGIGGPEMAAAGLECLFTSGQLAIMGLVEVVPHIPRILKTDRPGAGAIVPFPPAVLVTYHVPAF